LVESFEHSGFVELFMGLFGQSGVLGTLAASVTAESALPGRPLV
jgi:hypothetical protein